MKERKRGGGGGRGRNKIKYVLIEENTLIDFFTNI